MRASVSLLALLVAAEKVKEETVDDSPKYAVQLMTGALAPRSYANQKSVVMTKYGGKKFRCYLPSTVNNTEAIAENDQQPAPNVGSFLQPLSGTCFYRLEGWWTYEFCFLKSIRQFHQEKVKNSNQPDATSVTQDYTLGRFWSAESPGDGKQNVAKALEAEQLVLAEEQGAQEEQVPSTEGELELTGELLEDSKTRRMYWKQVYGNGTHCDLTG